MISKITSMIVCLIVICTVGTVVGSEGSLDFGKHTKCLAVTIRPTGEVRYFKFIGTGPAIPQQCNQKPYEFENFDGTKITYPKRSVCKIREINLNNRIKKLVREQLKKSPIRYTPVSNPPQNDQINLSRVTNNYYRSLIQKKLDETEKYRTEIKEIKAQAKLRWEGNSGRWDGEHKYMHLDKLYGRYDLDEAQKIKDLNAKADRCETEAKRLYKEYLHKL